MAPPPSKKTQNNTSSPSPSSSSEIAETEETSSSKSTLVDESEEEEEESTFFSDVVLASVPSSEFTPWVTKQIKRYLYTRASSQEDDVGSLEGSILSRFTGSSTSHGNKDKWRRDGKKKDLTFKLKSSTECKGGVKMLVSFCSFIYIFVSESNADRREELWPSLSLPDLSPSRAGVFSTARTR